MLQLEIASKHTDVVALTETHLDTSIADSKIFPSSFTVFRRDRQRRGRHGGSVLLAVENFYRIVYRDDTKSNAEVLCEDIMLKYNKKITLGVFYRPPNNELYPLEELQRILGELSTSELILVSDFNITEIDWTNAGPLKDSPLPKLLINIVHDNFLSQMVSTNKRGKHSWPCFYNIDRLCANHDLITFKIDRMPYEIRLPCNKYCYKKADWLKLRNLLQHVPWHFSLAEQDINSKWQAWKDWSLAAVDDCIPKVSAKRKWNIPWITQIFILFCKKKKTAYKMAKKV